MRKAGGLFKGVFCGGLVLLAGGLAACAEEHEAVDGALFTSFTPDGAWCWFADPRALYHEGAARKTYVGWISRADSTVAVAAYDHQTGEVETASLRTLHRNDHANPSLLMRPDGRLMVFYSAHNGDTLFYRTTARPEDLSAWEPERAVGANTQGDRGYTYPNPVQLREENDRIYLFWRGANWQPSFSYSDDGLSWAEARTLIEVPGERPYLKVASTGIDRIDFAFTDGHPRNVVDNSIYYALYRGGALYRADGTRIRALEDAPIAPAQADRVYDGGADSVRAWIWDVAIGGDGHPVIVYAALPSEDDHRYHYARWNGETWENHFVTAAGGSIDGPREPHYSGGIVLDHEDPSVVYLSRMVEGVHEIEQWTTADGGASWEVLPITAGSTHENVRPVSVRGHRGDVRVLWMHGTYIHYVDYDTALKAHPLGQTTPAAGEAVGS